MDILTALCIVLLIALFVVLWWSRGAVRQAGLAAEQKKAAEVAEQQTRLALLHQELDQTRQQLSQTKTELENGTEQIRQQQKKIGELNEELATFRTENNSLREAKAQLSSDLQQANDKCEQVQQDAHQSREALAALRSELQERQQGFERQSKQLKDEFSNLAQQVLEQKGKAFSEQNQKSLDALLGPFKQQIGEFKSRVETLHLEGAKQQTAMKTELAQLQRMHQQMSQEAQDLATALKGQKKMQGNWGEMVLENVLDRSGLRPDIDYKREVSLKAEDGQRSRPDVVVYLPQNKHLIIDAKVSLNAYTRLVNAENELERQQASKEHVQAFADRIKELADRDYYKLEGINSPEIVFMFVPIESAFVEALKADETLFQKAIERQVLVATPTTLLTSLNIVRQLWRFEDQNRHSAELAKKAEGVFKKLKTFLSSFDDVRKGLDRAQEAYQKAETQLLSGRGNLVKQVNDFKELAPRIKDELPEHFVEKAAMELPAKQIDTDKE